MTKKRTHIPYGEIAKYMSFTPCNEIITDPERCLKCEEFSTCRYVNPINMHLNEPK